MSLNNKDILNLTENEILNRKDLLPYLQNYFPNRQFSEEFLSKTINYYDSWICLKYQNNLSPYFCFKYLYDNNTDSADNWTSYEDIIKYFDKQEKKYSIEQLNNIFKFVTNEKIK